MFDVKRVRVHPTPEQVEFLNRQFGAVRFVWNKALAVSSHYFKVHGRRLSPSRDLEPLLEAARHSRKYAWLSEIDQTALKQSIHNLDAVLELSRADQTQSTTTRFKTKKMNQTSVHSTAVEVGENWVKIPKCSPIKAEVDDAISGQIRSITITRKGAGPFYALCSFRKQEASDTQAHRMTAAT